MQEVITQPAVALPEVQATEPLIAESVAGYTAELVSQSAQLPEVAENKDAIAEKGSELINEFGLTPELFEKPAHSLMFTALANRYANLEAARPGLTIDAYTREKEFIGDATALLAQGRSIYYEEYKDLIDTTPDTNDEDNDRAYDRVQNQQLTNELKQSIAAGLLDDVRQRLGITPENETPFDVVVLDMTEGSIDDQSVDVDLALRGLHPDDPENADDLATSDPRWQEHVQDIEDFQSYAKDLATKRVEFMRATGVAQVSMAWSTTLHGKRTIVMLSPFAEKILHPEEIVNSTYTDADHAADLALLEHEFTHTQGGLNLDNQINFGISLEEQRAEYFSGDKHGYEDIKASIKDLSTITGVELLDEIEAVKGGDAAAFYTKLAAEIGLDSLLETTLMHPRSYNIQSRPLLKNINEYLGNNDGVVKRIYARQLAAGHGGEIDARLDAWAEKLAEVPYALGYLDYRKYTYGAHFISDKLIPRVKAIQAEKGIAEQDLLPTLQ